MAGGEPWDDWLADLEAALERHLPPATDSPCTLHEAMRYASLGGGKRLRPLMAMASACAVGASPESAIDVGCAVEFVHCFSLVHDDLPSIDDDSLRRGQPTLHVAFGEGLATLAGDALFALAYECLARSGLTDRAKAAALGHLSWATGSRGLVGGEVLDVLAEGQTVTLEDVEAIHCLKTGRLFAASCALGALAGGADDVATGRLASYGERVGLAFQIVDDVLNATSTSEQLGKAAGSDAIQQKATYPAQVGLDGSRARAHVLVDEAIQLLEHLSGDTNHLSALAWSCIDRAA